MVKTLETSEKKVGNRGSKSDLSVKEQRVDGRWCTHLMHLRCTLMGFETNYPVKIPSNQVLKIRHYSSITIPGQSCELNPLFVTGFTDAEGSFMIRIRNSPRYNTG